MSKTAALRKTTTARAKTKKKKPREKKTITPGVIGATLRENILTLADHFVGLTDTTLGGASRQINGDHRFFADLRANTCSFTVRKYDEMIAKFRASWPEGATMPGLIDPTHDGGPNPSSPPEPKKDSKHGTRSKKA